MRKEVYLNVETSKGLIMIPFLGLRELDYFTVGYSNGIKLVDSLCKILNLSISIKDVIRIYISSDKYKNSGNSSLSYIKYRDDNYDVESVRDMLILYLRQDHRRIRTCDVRHVVTDGMINFKGGKSIGDNDIKLAVDAFLKNNYKKQRDMYFLIKNFGGIRINKLYEGYLQEFKRDLSKMELRDDDRYQYLIEDSELNDDKLYEDVLDSGKDEVVSKFYQQYLVELASRGQDEFDKAMDELSKIDLEDIRKMLKGGNVFDGIYDRDNNVTEDQYALEELTGLSIKSLKKLLADFCCDNILEYEINNGIRR